MTLLRSYLADVLHADLFGEERHSGCCPCFEEADALLADSVLDAIFKLAVLGREWTRGDGYDINPVALAIVDDFKAANA